MKLLLSVAAEFLMRIPKRHLIERYAEFRTGVSSQMLVGKEEHFVELFEINIKERHGIRRRADDTFVTAAKGLDRRRRIIYVIGAILFSGRSREAVPTHPRPDRSSPYLPSSIRRRDLAR